MKCFRKNEDRTTPSKVKIVKWNTVMDLIAIGMKSGDVSIHRLVSWQRIWLLSWPGRPTDVDKSKFDITSMEWRPDGKVLAIGYSINVKNLDSFEDSSIALVDIENGQVIDVIVIPQNIVTKICWQSKSDFQLNEEYKATAFTEFLPKIPPLGKSNTNAYSRKYTEEGIEDLMKITSQSSLNMLAIGTNTSKIYFYCFGVFLAGILDINEPQRIDYIGLSSDLGSLTVLLTQEEPNSEPLKSEFILKTYRLPFFRESSGQYYMLSHLYAKITSLLSYLDDIMGALQENMEEMLLELDSKLSNLQSKNPNGSSNILLADELLELLVIGTMSDSLDKFLNQLTDKGLKKLGHSIESLYSNLQKLVVCNVQRVCERIFSYLHVLRSMTLWKREFHLVDIAESSDKSLYSSEKKELSLILMKTEDMNRALHSVASFFFKALELQQVIDSSSQNVKCFFRWLYAVTCRFNNDSLPPNESNKLSQQDLHYVADFIEENFDYQELRADCDISDLSRSSRPTATNFTLERVAQYLKPEPLAYQTFSVSENGLNPWFKYLKERPMLLVNDNESNLILYGFNPETSLVGEHQQVMQSINEAFKTPNFVISDGNQEAEDSNVLTRLRLQGSESALRMTHLSVSTKSIFLLGFCFNEENYHSANILRFSMDQPIVQEFVAFDISLTDEDGPPMETRPIDIQFYNEEILSMILQVSESKVFYLIQFPIMLVDDKFVSVGLNKDIVELLQEVERVHVNVNSSMPEVSFRKLDEFKPLRLSVSGSRRVACISSKGQKRLRIFEMDANDDEELEDEEK